MAAVSGDLPSYGNRLAQAPNIEALMASGTRCGPSSPLDLA
jgi:hypothetical protein